LEEDRRGRVNDATHDGDDITIWMERRVRRLWRGDQRKLYARKERAELGVFKRRLTQKARGVGLKRALGKAYDDGKKGLS